MTISFKDNNNSIRILNLNQVNQVSYDDDARYFMVYFNEDTETFTFRSVEYRDEILEKIQSILNTVRM